MFFNIFRQYKINVKQETGGTWKNWSKNIWYDGPANYIKYLKTKEELRAILQDASDRGITVRAAGCWAKTLTTSPDRPRQPRAPVVVAGFCYHAAASHSRST